MSIFIDGLEMPKTNMMLLVEPNGKVWEMGDLLGNDKLLDGVKAIPAADVRENKKRYWYEDEAGCAICSECREYAFETSTHHISGWFPRFCPNCGADMREES